MSVSIKKIPGVESVNVSLKQGLVSIALNPGNAVRIEQIRKAILDDAFKPKDAHAVVAGELVSQKGKFYFRVAGTNELFPVAALTHMRHMPWQNEAGHAVLATALISAPAKGTEGGTLQIIAASPLSAVPKEP
ncbi:MAG: heavy-metal-associated domain-containing protein [Candidatus Acidiferrales bacterium]